MEAFLQQALSFTGSLHLKLIIFLFLVCGIGEAGLSIPYLLETTWLLAGYNLGAGILSPFQLLLLWLVAVAGRQAGALVLYFLTRLGSNWLMRLYQKHFKAALSDKPADSESKTYKFLRHLNSLSPFSVALARLLWLRIPLTLTLGFNRQIKPLVLGILISSLAYDAIYILLGLIGGKAMLSQGSIIVYSLIGVTALYIVFFVLRYLSKMKLYE